MRVDLRRWAGRVADHEIWPLTAAVALATWSARMAPWGLGLIAALWLARWIGRGRLSVRTPLDWPAVLFLLVIPVTFYVTTDRQTTFEQVSRLLAGLALAYGIINWAQRQSHAALLGLGLTGVGLGLALIAPFTVGWFSRVKSFVIPGRVYDALPTLVSDTIHPNLMAGALVMLLPFPVAALLLSPGRSQSVRGSVPGVAAKMLDQGWFRALWHWGAASLMLGALLLTKSRAGWIAAAVAVFIVSVRRWRLLLWLIPISLVGVGLVFWLGDVPQLLDWVSTGDLVSGWDGRVEIWSRALYMIQDFPFSGIGAGTFESVANVLYPFFLAGPDAKIPHAHNLLLQVGVDLGFQGLIAFMALLLVALWSAVDGARFYHRRGRLELSAVAWAGLAGLVGMVVHGMMHASTWIVGRGAFVPWAVIGTVVALANRPESTIEVEKAALGRPEKGQSGELQWLGVGLVALTAVGVMGWYILRGGPSSSDRTTIRVPLHPEARGAEVRTEEAPSDAGWNDALEVATFTTTHPISDVVTYYRRTLTEGGWETNIEAGDDESWGGIYTQNNGYSVCLLNVFAIEGDVWASIVCGDKTQPVDFLNLSPVPTPEVADKDER